MFSHVMIGTNDLERAKRFYDALLGTLGVKPAMVDGNRIFYRSPTSPPVRPSKRRLGMRRASPRAAPPSRIHRASARARA